MQRAYSLLLAATLVLTSACSTTKINETINQGLREGRESGLVTNTILHYPPSGLERAWIYEIDGEPVNYHRRTFRLPIGEHTIRVWPKDSAALNNRMVPDRTRIIRENITVESITINVEPGYRYYLAARTNIVRTRSTIPGTDVTTFPTQKFVIPVVSREAEPLDFVEGVTGLGLFAAPLIIAPLAAPAAF